MKAITGKLERIIDAINSITEYEENGNLCGYEIETYTGGGVNQIIFLDFRDTEKDPKNADDFINVLEDRINSIDIDEEIELNRHDSTYREHFTLRESLKDFEEWQKELKNLVKKLKKIK